MIQYSTYNVDNKNVSFVFAGQNEKQSNRSKTYQITTTGFNPRSDGFLFTTGSNAQVNFWDIDKKNKKQVSSLNH